MTGNRLASIFITAIFLLYLHQAHAEEGGSGHYLPGSIASFMDGVAPTETFIARVNIFNYQGDAGLGRRLPIAGQTALNAEARSTVVGLTFFWRPEWGGIGERWSYGMSATIPFIDMRVSADVATALGKARRTDKASGLGDLILMPLMFNYNVNPDFNINMRLTFYAPTGSFEVGRLANTGKNFWSVEPLFGLMYFGQKNGIEASLFGGLTINQENSATDYKSGNQLHFDGTLAQHFPLVGGLASVGVTGFYYKQVTGDSGAGARFGDFKAKTVGIGPSVSYVRKLNGQELLAELKWLHETETENRLEGDTVFLKVMLKF
jgi:hypothetical protein